MKPLPFCLLVEDEVDLLEAFFSFFVAALDVDSPPAFLSRPLWISGVIGWTYLDFGMPVLRIKGVGREILPRRRKSYLVLGFSSDENLARLDEEGGRSTEVESVGEVASDGARNLRLVEIIVEGGEGRVCLSLRLAGLRRMPGYPLDRGCAAV